MKEACEKSRTNFGSLVGPEATRAKADRELRSELAAVAIYGVFVLAGAGGAGNVTVQVELSESFV